MGVRRHGGANWSYAEAVPSTLQIYLCLLVPLTSVWVCLPQLTYVDFIFYEILDHHRLFEPALLEGYPVLKVSLSLILSV